MVEETRKELQEIRDNLHRLSGSPEEQAVAVARSLEKLEGMERRLPESQAIQLELAQARAIATDLRDSLWRDAQHLMQSKAVGLTLARRLERMEKSVHLLELAERLDREEDDTLKQNLATATRRLRYLQNAQARAKENRGRRLVVYGIVAAAGVAALLTFCFASKLVSLPAFMTGGRAMQPPLANPTDRPSLTPTQVAALAPTHSTTQTPVHTATQALTPTITQAPTRTATQAPSDTPGPTASHTATPAPTDTATAAPSPTPIPQSTNTPAAEPTPRPTEPATTEPETASPATLPTPLPTLTGTLGLVYPAPILLEPEDISLLSQATYSTYPLRWEWAGALQADEWFDVRVWRKGLPHYGVAWTKQQEYLYDLCLQGSGDYYWSIAVVRGKDGLWLVDLSPEAPPHRFTSARSEDWCTQHGRYSLPSRSEGP